MRSRSGAVSDAGQLVGEVGDGRRPCRPPRSPRPAAASPARPATTSAQRAACSSALGQEVVDALRLRPAQEVEHLVLLVGQRPLQAAGQLLVDRLQGGVALA